MCCGEQALPLQCNACVFGVLARGCWGPADSRLSLFDRSQSSWLTFPALRPCAPAAACSCRRPFPVALVALVALRCSRCSHRSADSRVASPFPRPRLSSPPAAPLPPLLPARFSLTPPLTRTSSRRRPRLAALSLLRAPLRHHTPSDTHARKQVCICIQPAPSSTTPRTRRAMPPTHLRRLTEPPA